MSKNDSIEEQLGRLQRAADALTKLRARAVAVATSAVTLLSGLAVLVTTFSADIAAVVPEGYADDVTRVSVTVLAWLATAVAALRRVTPVDKTKRGVLPK